MFLSIISRHFVCTVLKVWARANVKHELPLTKHMVDFYILCST